MRPNLVIALAFLAVAGAAVCGYLFALVLDL